MSNNTIICSLLLLLLLLLLRSGICCAKSLPQALLPVGRGQNLTQGKNLTQKLIIDN